MATIDADNKPPEPTTNEAGLTAGREPLAALLRHWFDAVALTDRESRRTAEVSDSFCALTGYPREELIGRTSVEVGLIAEDGVRARVIEQVDRGKAGLYEQTLRGKDGEPRRVEFSLTLLPGGLVLQPGLAKDRRRVSIIRAR
jgi:PAS domain S-box-containing protein